MSIRQMERRERFERWAIFYAVACITFGSIGLAMIGWPLVWLFISAVCGFLAQGSKQEAKDLTLNADKT